MAYATEMFHNKDFEHFISYTGSAFYRHFMEKRAASVQGSDSVEANKPSGNGRCSGQII